MNKRIKRKKENKHDFVKAIAEKIDFTQKDVATVLDGYMSVVSDALAAGDDIRLTGFGTYSTTSRAARTGRNPSTGESIEIPASRGVKFKAGKALKAAVAL